jgi:hypothetical protein
VRVEPARRVEHDAERVGSFDVAGRELRVVRRHGARANDHGVRQRTEAVQVDDVLVPGDELGIPTLRRDEAVEALAEVADGDRPRLRGVAEGQIQLEDEPARVAGVGHGLPACRRAPREDGGGILRADFPQGVGRPRKRRRFCRGRQPLSFL